MYPKILYKPGGLLFPTHPVHFPFVFRETQKFGYFNLIVSILIFCRLERESDKEREEIAVSGIDDVVIILKSDYENAYFVTGTLFRLHIFYFQTGLKESFSDPLDARVLLVM